MQLKGSGRELKVFSSMPFLIIGEYFLRKSNILAKSEKKIPRISKKNLNPDSIQLPSYCLPRLELDQSQKVCKTFV